MSSSTPDLVQAAAMTLGLPVCGKFRLLRPGLLTHWCPGCGTAHTIDIHALSRNGHTTGWDGDLVRPSFGEPVRHDTDRGICEYLMRAGVIYFMSSSWHPLSGKSRHLEDFPR